MTLQDEDSSSPPTSVSSIVLLSSFHWREVITGPYESEMNESIRGWMEGHGRRASGE